MNNRFTGRGISLLGAMLLLLGMAMGYYAGRGSRPPDEIITVKEPEEAEPEPVAAEEKFMVTTVNIFECGHILEKPEGIAVSAGEAEALTQRMGGYNFELKDGKMALYREFDYCCPEHYYAKRENGGVNVYRTDGETLEKKRVCRLDVPEDSAALEEMDKGMMFSDLEEINLYIEGIDE